MDNLAAPRLSDKFKPVQTASFGDDAGVHVQFDDDFVKNEFQSEIQGRVISDHFHSIEMQWPGDNTKSYKYRWPVDKPDITAKEYINRFPRQWEAFKNSTKQVSDGTPIELWPPIDKKMVFELKANNIFSVEQIAAVKDADVMGALGLHGRKLRDQAIAFLNPSVGQVQISKLTRENEDLQNKVEIMQQQIAAMMQGRPLPDNTQNLPTPKKRGPKPKHEAA